MGGCSDATYAHYAFHQNNVRFKDWDDMDMYEKAMTIASIEVKAKKDDIEASKLK